MNDGGRVLARADRRLGPIVWEAREPRDIAVLAEMDSPWVWPRGQIGTVPEQSRLLIGVDGDELQRRRGRALMERLDQLGRTRCEGVVLENCDSARIKAGGPFHRLGTLREQGVLDLMLVEAVDHASAEWMLTHSPAHAIVLPFDLLDATAAYRLLSEAGGYGTGILARPVNRPVWNPPHDIDLPTRVRFVMAHETVTALVLPVPSGIDDIRQLIDAARHPMTLDQRQNWWERFARQVPPPPPLPRTGPPDSV